MINLENLHAQLKRAGVSDDMLSRGLRLTQTGMQKMARKFNATEDEVKDAIGDLSRKIRDDQGPAGLPTLEGASQQRFAYEADALGNVMLRDTETGAEKFITGQEAQLLLSEIERVHPEFQSLISPYFQEEVLREFAETDVLGVDDDGNTGGTFNFPYKGKFACARFWLQNNTPRIEIVSLVDMEGEEVHMDTATKDDVTKVAWEWVDKV